MLKVWGWFARSPVTCLAMLLLLTGAFLGSNRIFGFLLLLIPFLAVTLACIFIAVLSGVFIKAHRAHSLASLTMICLIPLAYLHSYGPAQRIRFLLWAPAHYRELAQASEKNGIVMNWDNWGMVGQDTFSYLVVDTEDRLESQARVDEWTRQIGQSCGIWEKRRVWPRLYIVTTYTSCAYDGVALIN